jgi:glycosyltransferase involved in cell wall biosynthesis
MTIHVNRRLSVLNILLSITETSGAYNQHCLAVADQRDITIHTFFTPDMPVPKDIPLYEGHNSIRGFFRTIKDALAAKDYDVIHAHSPHVGFLFAIADLLMAGKYVPITVYNVQNSYQNYKLRNKLLMLPVFAYFRRVVCCSQACLESFPAVYRWLAGDRLRVVPNGLDIARVDRAMAEYTRKQSDETFTVASVGRLIPIKDPHTLLRAFHQGADATSQLIFIGEGAMRDELTAEVRARSIGDRVEFTGLVPRDQVFERLSRADVVVSTSHGEGLPVAVIEAMACRCPVILSDIEPHREIVGNADCVPLVAPGNVAGFAREIERFRLMSAAERARIGEQCRRIVEERFSLEAMNRDYEAIYAQVIGQGHRGEVAV